MTRRGPALLAALVAGCAASRPRPPLPPPPDLPATAPAPRAAPEPAGSTHVVRGGETLYRIARTYGVDLGELMRANEISDPRALKIGTPLFVPGAARSLEVPALGSDPPAPDPPPAPAAAPGRSRLRWPLDGVLYSRFGPRQGQRHDGIDIAAPEGTAVRAAAAGKVVYAGRQAGYGRIVILRHEDGLVTVYAHVGAVLVSEGQVLPAGAAVARVGQSGRTSGPHLHFEVREGTRPRNPLLYLP